MRPQSWSVAQTAWGAAAVSRCICLRPLRSCPMSRTAAARAGEELLQVVSFHVDEEEFGLEILRVQEIIRIQPLTRVPASPVFVEGVINLRGRIIPVISLRKRFGLVQREADKQTRIVVVEVNGTVLGFMV